jgi:hypothetical protein
VDFSFSSNGQIANVAVGSTGHSGYMAEATTASIGELAGFVETPAGGGSGFALDTTRMNGTGSFEDPAIAPSDPQFVLFVRDLNPSFPDGNIEFVPATEEGIKGSPTPLPGVVNTSLDESQPAVTPDERFIAFVRHGVDGHDRLFLWDSQTQLLFNSKGVDLGAIDSHDLGSVSLYTKPVFSNGHVIVQASQSALAAFVARSGEKGILVQRIVGRQRILGRREYRLRTVGRVPLGRFTNGHHRVHWNLRVNGKRLRRGRYLVTLRALSRQGVIRDLAKPDVIRIR